MKKTIQQESEDLSKAWNKFMIALVKMLYLDKFIIWLDMLYESKRNRKFAYLILIGIGLLPFAIILIGELLQK